MTTKEIEKIRNRIAVFIDSRRLRDAIFEIKSLANKLSNGDAIDKLEQAEQSYAYMLKYMSDGINDPERDTIYNNIVLDLYACLDTLLFAVEKEENTSLYFSSIRVRARNSQTDEISRLLSQYTDIEDKLSIFSLLSTGEDDKERKSNQALLEELQSSLFTAVWTSTRLSSSDMETLASLFSSESYSSDFKEHIISALWLGLMQNYDSRKLEVLMNAYMTSEDIKVTTAALVGLLLGLWLYRNRPLSKNLTNRLASLKEKPNWRSDLRTAFIEMIRARDTERINQKIQNEVIPDMLNLRPELMDKINGGQINMSDLSLQENPEWQELLDKSGITGKLKELTEIQMEGGDVMMSTFAHLKGFPFFEKISNWFLPFSPQHSLVESSAKRLGVMSDMIENATFLCDSDKYSFMFALDMVPKAQREMMTAQFQSQSSDIYQAMSDANGTTAPEARRRALNSYMQNIYRFFKLFKRKGEFFDPFNTGINLVSVPALASDFDDPEMLRVVAEFYFKLGYMQDALDIFNLIDTIEPGDSQMYQKMGYCCERLRNYSDAIDYYQHAEILDSDSQWTAKRLAACYRAIGNKDMALKYYQRLANSNPDDLSLALLLGYVLSEKGEDAEALKQFYKVEFLDEKSTKSWRPLAWTLFLTGDLKASMRYYDKIATNNPKSGDYLNMGHVALADGDMRNAINYYTQSIQTNNGNRDAFLQSLNDDLLHLQKAGVDQRIIPLVADAVFYSLDK